MPHIPAGIRVVYAAIAVVLTAIVVTTSVLSTSLKSEMSGSAAHVVEAVEWLAAYYVVLLALNPIQLNRVTRTWLRRCLDFLSFVAKFVVYAMLASALVSALGIVALEATHDSRVQFVVGQLTMPVALALCFLVDPFRILRR